MDDDVMIQFPLIKHQLIDVLKLYNGKSKDQVIANGSFRREVLADTVYALKDIAEKLVKMVDTINNGNKWEKQIEKLVHETLPEVVRSTMESMGTKSIEMPYRPDKNQDTEQHVVLVESENGNFNKDTWAETVKKINGKLKEVPVKKNLVNKNGQGCILLPDRESQEKAEAALRDDFVVVASTKQSKKLMPKMKICDLDGYDRNDKSALKEAILQKNPQIKQLVNDEGKTLDVLFIDEQNRYSVIKVSPEVRSVFLKFSSVYIGMRSHHVRDQFHLTQCFCCQQYGHKQGSEHCSLRDGNINICLYCGENHRSKDCLNKQDKSKHTCSNCCKSSNPAHHRLASGHTTTSMDCPIRLKELKFLVNRTNGLSFSKNFPHLLAK